VYCIIEITASIQPNFAQTTNAFRGWSKYTNNKSKMADGGEFEKFEKSTATV